MQRVAPGLQNQIEVSSGSLLHQPTPRLTHTTQLVYDIPRGYACHVIVQNKSSHVDLFEGDRRVGELERQADGPRCCWKSCVLVVIRRCGR